MTILRRATHIAIVGLGAVAVSQTAAAETAPGFYLGVSGGDSTYDLEKSEFDAIARSAFFSQGVPVLSSSSSFEDGGTALTFFAGYRFNPYVAVEGSYVDLGAAEFRWTGSVNPPGPVTSTPAAVSADIEANGFAVAAVGSLPFGNIFDVHGRLGFFFADTDITTGVTIGSGRSQQTDTLDSKNVFVGVGAAVHLGNHFSVSLDWNKYAQLADGEDFFEDDDENSEGTDATALTLSAIFRF